MDHAMRWGREMLDALTVAPLFLPVLVAVGLTALALVFRGLLLRRLAALIPQDQTESAGLLWSGLRLPSLLWCAVLGLYGGMEAAALPASLSRRLGLLLQVLLVLSVTVTAANLLAALVARFGERRTLHIGVTGLAQTVVKTAVLVLGGLILLGTLGVAITPILTALGIGGLAVALALQDTLSNFFAGLYLLADRAIQVGDFVKLESGVAGIVEDIGWRSTRIRLLEKNLLVVPNSKLAQSMITKLSHAEPEVGATSHQGR